MLGLSTEIILASYNFQISIFLFFSTLFIYNFQRVVRLKIGDQHMRKEWFYKNKVVVYVLMLLSLVISGYYFSLFNFSTQFAIFFITILSLFYPFFLRKVPFIKIFLISIVWTIGTTVLLVLENKLIFSEEVILNIIARFLFVFAITIPFDIRDIKYDTGKLITLPLVLGVNRTKFLAFLALAICSIIHINQFLFNMLDLYCLLALILLYFTSIIFVANSNQKRDDLYFSFLGESLSICSYIFLGILLLIF